MKLEISVIALCFIMIALVITLTDYGMEVIDNYEQCHTCVKDNTEYRCDCRDITEYSQNPLFWIAMGFGAGLLIMNFFIKQ